MIITLIKTKNWDDYYNEKEKKTVDQGVF